MATWVNYQHLENWAGVDGIYLTYESNVSRSGNTITVSGQHVTWSKRGYSSANGYWYALYLERNDNGNWTRVQTVWSGNMYFGLYEYPDYQWYPGDFTFTADSSSTSRQFRFINSDGDGVIYFTLTFPEGYTAPATPTLTLTPAITSVSATYGTSSFGNPSTGTITLYGDTSSTPTTVLDSKLTTGNTTYSHTGLTANTKYYYKAYADNTKKNSTKTANTVTKVNAPTVSVNSVTGTSITINYTTQADGGEYSKAIEYSIDGGTTWTTGATVSSGSASSGNYTISNLTTGQTYTIQTRVTTTAGTTTGSTLTAVTGPNVPTISISSRNATTIGLKFSESAFNSTSGRSLSVRGGTVNPPTTTITTQSSPQDGTEYSFIHTSLTSNTRYYYRAVAQATFSGSTVAVMSDVIQAITYSPVPTISSITWVEFPTASTQKYNFSVSVPADGGALSKDIQYRVQVDGTWTSWATFSTVSSGSATTVTGNFTVTNTSSDEKTGTLQVRTHTSSFDTGTNSSTFTIKAKAGAPTVDTWQLVDNNPDVVAITGNNTVFVAGYSVPKISVAQSAIHLADGATIAQIKGTFDGVTQNLTLSSGTYTAYFADPTSGSKTGTLYIKDNLDGDVTKTLTRTVLAYSTPTITGSYVRSSLDGKVNLSLAGNYSPLTVGGVEKNPLTVTYKVSDSEGTVVDWTEVQVTRNNGVYTALVQNIPTDYNGDFLIEFEIEDGFENATGSLVVTAIKEESILHAPQYDIEVWTRDGEFVADISKYITSDLQITWKLNDIEELSFDVSMDAIEILSEAGAYALLTPYAHDIRVRRNGDYIVGCQVVEANLKIDNEQIPSIQIKATGFLNIFKDQYISEPLAGYSYPEIAHKLINRAQHADCLIKNPTGDIDASYWLSPVGAIAQTTVAKAGAGAIQCVASSGSWTGLGAQMNVKAGTPIHLDMWISGKAGTVYIRERELINQSSNQVSLTSLTLSANNTYTHYTADYTTSFDNGYIYIEENQVGTAIRVDNCFISRADDEDSLNNHYVGCIYSGLDDTTGGTGHNYATSGYTSDREFNYELQNVKDAIMDLVNLGEDEFDFEFTPDRIFNTYARKGQDKAELPIVYPGNVYSLDVTRSAADMANKIQNIGSGIGDERLEVVVSDTDSRQAYGTRESIVTNNNVSLEETLQGQAEGDLIDRKEPTKQLSVTIQDGSINPAVVETGDSLPFKIDIYKGVLHQQLWGEKTPTNLLESMEGWYKVKSIRTRVNKEGVESTNLTLEFVDGFPVLRINLKLRGDMYQPSYTGKNVLSLNNAVVISRSHVAELHGDNDIYLSADGTAGTQYVVANFKNIDASKTYVMSGKAKKYRKDANTTNNRLWVRWRGSNDDGTTWTGYQQIYLNTSPSLNFEYSFTNGKITGYSYVQILFYDNNSGAANSTEETAYYDLQIEESSTSTSYEPYTGKMKSPNPEFPQDIKVVTGSQTVQIGNLLHNTVEQGGIQSVDGQDQPNASTQRCRTTGYTQVKPSTAYRLYSFTKVFDSTFQALIFQYDKDKNYIRYDGWKSFPDGVNFTTQANTKYVRFSFRFANDVVFYPYDVKGLQLSLSSNVLPLSLGSTELCALDGYEDRIFNDEGTWKIHKELGKKAVKDWSSWTTPNNCFQSQAISDKKWDTKSVCTHFTFNSVRTSISTVIVDGEFGYNTSDVPTFKNTDITTTANWNTWLATNDPQIYYILKNSTDTTISDSTLLSQLEAIEDALSENPDEMVTIYAQDVYGEDKNLPIIVDTPEGTYGQVSCYIDNTYTSKKTVKLQSQNDVNELYWADGHTSAQIDGETIPMDSIYSVELSKSVNTLPTGFLRNATHLEKVDISESNLSSTPDYFLAGCTLFNSKFDIPTSVTQIGNYFMEGDTSFNQEIELPNLADATLGQYFMRNCTSFNKKVKIPPFLTTIRAYFLAGCTSFNQPVVLPSGLKTIYGYFLYQCSSFNQPIEIPSGTTTIDAYFLSATAYNHPIVIPNGVTRIYGHFLRDCPNFNSPVTLPSGVTRIDSSFLRNCPVFDQPVDIPSGVTMIGSEFLYMCPEFNHPIVIPSGVTVIEANFLSGCKKYNYPLAIPNGVTQIKDNLLYNANVFNYPITVPNTVTTIGAGFLQYCYAFNSALTLSTNLTSIGNNFLRSCWVFNQPLTIPSGITSIGANFLYETKVFNYPIAIPSGVTEIKDGFLCYAYKFNQEVVFPTNAITIGNSVLRSCQALNKPVTLSPNTGKIGEYFMNDSRVFNRDFIIPSTVTSIGISFFGNQRNMQSTITVGNLPATVAADSSYTFSAYSTSVPAYTTGIAIKGANRSAWLARFLNRTTSPYRKLRNGGA